MTKLHYVILSVNISVTILIAKFEIRNKNVLTDKHTNNIIFKNMNTEKK